MTRFGRWYGSLREVGALACRDFITAGLRLCGAPFRETEMGLQQGGLQAESFKLHDTINRQSTFKDDIELLPKSLPSPKTPASFAYRLDSKDGGKYEWMMITFVPDDAGVSAPSSNVSADIRRD